MNTAAEPLLDPAFLRKLEQWSLAVRRVTGGQYAGERRSKRHGHSVEFADFRNYVPGDDIRFVDWNLYARLERLYLKLFLHQQELNVHILVDLSESMTFGSPSKSLMARRLAAAIGMIALTQNDGLTIDLGTSQGTARERHLALCRGRPFTPRMMGLLGDAPEGGPLRLSEFVEAALKRIRRPGLVIIISDFLEPESFEPALRAVIARRHEAVVLHVLDREEWEPTLTGDLNLIDAESEDNAEVSINPAILARYRTRVTAWSESMALWCTARGLTYARVLNDASPEDVILKTLRRLGRLG